MTAIRNTILTVVVTLAFAVAAYLTIAPQTVQAASPCGKPAASWLSTEELKALVNGRYAHRVALPR